MGGTWPFPGSWMKTVHCDWNRKMAVSKNRTNLVPALGPDAVHTLPAEEAIDAAFTLGDTLLPLEALLFRPDRS